VLSRLLARLAGRFDLLQVNHLGPALLAALRWGRRHGIPVILVPWGSCRPGVGPFRRWPHLALLRAAARRATAVIALSRDVSQMLVSTWGFDPARLTVIPNGVDTARFRPLAGSAPPEGFPSGSPVAIAVGRLIPAKRHDLLLEAWRRARSRLPPLARLLLLGDGPERQALEARAAQLGLSASVSFPGSRADPERWLRASDLYVTCSDSEGMSNALLEAMASGLPVLATRISGSQDLVRDGIEGKLVPPGDADRLAEALVALLGDAGRRRFGEAARRTVVDGYSLEQVARRYLDLYEQLRARARP
jgi:glycosyltransferase involved in cell wall biosynthesis